MLRAGRLRLCAVPGDAPFMGLADAYGMFGYQLSDRLESKTLKKKFNEMALEMHPDRGGDDKMFQRLIEAHKILQAACHDRRGKGGEFRFRTVDPNRVQNRPTRPNGHETEDGVPVLDHLTVEYRDMAYFAAFVVIVVMAYWMHCYDVQSRITAGRHRLTEDKMQPGGGWHPWNISQDMRDQMDEVAVLQGSLTAEQLAEKRQRKGELSPFAA